MSPLPTSRDITASSGQQIPSTLANNIQDMIVGGRHGPIRRITQALYGQGPGFDSSTPPPDYQTLTPSGATRLIPGAAFMIPLQLAAGEILNDCNVMILGPITQVHSFQLVEDGLLIGTIVNHPFATASTYERVAVNAAFPFTVPTPSPPTTLGQYAVHFTQAAASNHDIALIDYEVSS
jgi:hypothetical protein